MLDLTQLAEMTPEQRTAEFDRLFDALWPNSSNKALTAETKLGVTKPTYFGWRRKHNVPPLVILLMQEWSIPAAVSKEVQEWNGVVAKLGGITDTIEQLTAQIGQLSADLAELADRRADAQEQTACADPDTSDGFPQSSPE
jgi:hypothetical protein